MDLFQQTEKLIVWQIPLINANTFVKTHHRHNRPTTGHKFSLGCYKSGKLVGVAICGRPIARRLDDGKTIEVNRLCSDGTQNVCSKLLGACVRYARAMGFVKIVTYTLMSENGASIRAANFVLDAENVGGKKWTGHRSESRQNKGIVGSSEYKKRWIYLI